MEWRRKREISLAEQQLLNYFRMCRVTIGTSVEKPDLWLKWTVDVQGNHQMVEVQCHRALSYSHLRDSLLVAEDGMFSTALPDLPLSPPLFLSLSLILSYSLFHPPVLSFAHIISVARSDKMACISSDVMHQPIHQAA